MADADDKNRKAILARRARFMAAALTATTNCNCPGPFACLEPMPPPRTVESNEDDPWAEQRAKAKAVEDELAKARGDAGEAQPPEDQIPAHRRGEADAKRDTNLPRPRVCLSIQVIRGVEAGPDAGTKKK
jgi:hypothetical protein